MARVYDSSLTHLPPNQRYVPVFHDCSEHNAAVDARNHARRFPEGHAAQIPTARAELRRIRRGRITQTKRVNVAEVLAALTIRAIPEEAIKARQTVHEFNAGKLVDDASAKRMLRNEAKRRRQGR